MLKDLFKHVAVREYPTRLRRVDTRIQVNTRIQKFKYGSDTYPEIQVRRVMEVV